MLRPCPGRLHQTRGSLGSPLKICRPGHGPSPAFIHSLRRASSDWGRNVQLLLRQQRARELKLSFKFMCCEHLVSSFGQGDRGEEHSVFEVRPAVGHFVMHFCLCLWRDCCKTDRSLRFVYFDLDLKVLWDFLSVFKRGFVVISIPLCWKGPWFGVLAHVHLGVEVCLALLVRFYQPDEDFSLSWQNLDDEFVVDWNFRDYRLFSIVITNVLYFVALIVADF